MDNSISVNIGIQRFDRIREQKAFYIDKTDFIETYIKPPAELGRLVDASGDEWSIRIKTSVVQ